MPILKPSKPIESGDITIDPNIDKPIIKPDIDKPVVTTIPDDVAKQNYLSPMATEYMRANPDIINSRNVCVAIIGWEFVDLFGGDSYEIYYSNGYRAIKITGNAYDFTDYGDDYNISYNNKGIGIPLDDQIVEVVYKDINRGIDVTNLIFNSNSHVSWGVKEPISKFMVGNQEVNRLYVGTEKIWG